MGAEYGKQMGLAIRAVLDMQADCIKLIQDMDRALGDYTSYYGNVVTLNLGSSISKRTYLAEGLIRLYVRPGREERILGLNICFYDQNDRRFTEPIFVIADITYLQGHADPTEKLKRGWDPWYLFLAWGAADRPYHKRQTITKPVKRPHIEQAVVVAAPLYDIVSLEAAMSLIEFATRPE